MAKYRKGPSWAAVILGLIFCWPLGVYFLIKKARTDKEAAVRKDNKSPAMGWLLLFLGFFFFSSFVGGGSFHGGRLFFALFLIFGGIIALSTIRKNNQDGEQYRRYIDAIVNHGLTSIQDIAAFAQTDIKRVYKDLRKMIHMGYFDHAHIDERRGEIYIYQRRPHVNLHDPHYGGEPGAERGHHPGGGSAPAGGVSAGGAPANGAPVPHDAQPAAGAAEVLAACRNCGAQNWVVPGSRNSCEFCGSPIA